MTTTAPRKEHAYYAGFHSYGPDPGDGAFQIRWFGGQEARAGWYHANAEGGDWKGPFTSSREAFRDAKLSVDSEVETH